MKKYIFSLLTALCLLLTGCAGLLERSYGVVEPYSARFWESGDTLKASGYQDLVNSLLMLVEERSEEGYIRFYPDTEDAVHIQAAAAAQEVRRDTLLGAYLLSDITFTQEASETYSTLNFHITYRADAEDPDSIMRLRDTQSLMDLLRLAERENHRRLTARFVYEVSREEVEAVVESLWQELQGGENSAPEESAGEQPSDTSGETEGAPVEEASPSGEAGPESDSAGESTVTKESGPPAGEEGTSGEIASDGETPDGKNPDGEAAEEPAGETQIVYPPCPWKIRFYPDLDRAEMVEILLR